MEYIRRWASPLGGILLLSDGESLTGLYFDGQRHAPADKPRTPQSVPVLTEAERWLETYFRGRAPAFTPPLRLAGTPFQRAVWAELLTVPFGETVTYGQIAARLGASPRAVGGAVGRNPVSLIVPCHRVIGADGKLTGYAGGLDRKRFLLRLEGIIIY